MPQVAITGGSGFVGQHLISRLLLRHDVTTRALAHRAPDSLLMPDARLQWIRGDLAQQTVLADLLGEGCTLVNLAFPARWSHEAHLRATANLALAAAGAGVKRVIHCSTAAVAGRAASNSVTESTPPEPATGYEQTKLDIEAAWRRHAANKFELVIARPTAVFGPCGKNLNKMAEALRFGNRTMNYLRSSLLGYRKMNLLCVSNLVAALEFLIDSGQRFNADTFIVSDDDEDGNDYRNVERALMRGLAVPEYALPPLRVPLGALSVGMRLLAPAKAPPARLYDNSLLRKAGWRKRCPLHEGVVEFAQWHASTYRHAPDAI